MFAGIIAHMSKFAKLFDLESGDQVLVVLRADEEKETGLLLSTTTEIEGVSMSISVGFGSEEAAELAFDGYGEEEAKKFHAGMTQMLKEEA